MYIHDIQYIRKYHRLLLLLVYVNRCVHIIHSVAKPTCNMASFKVQSLENDSISDSISKISSGLCDLQIYVIALIKTTQTYTQRKRY